MQAVYYPKVPWRGDMSIPWGEVQFRGMKPTPVNDLWGLPRSTP